MADITNGMALAIYQRKVLIELCQLSCDTLNEATLVNHPHAHVFRAQAMMLSAVLDTYRKDIENERTVDTITGISDAMRRIASPYRIKRPDGSVIDYIDGNPTNNHPDNLRVVSRGDTIGNKAGWTGASADWYAKYVATLDRNKEQGGQS